MKNRITELFGIKYPIISGGMVWCSGWELASAVSNAGGLGLIGAGSMYPEVLREHIHKCNAATDKPFGVNIPLISKYSEELIKVVIEENVPIVFTSAGNPKTWTAMLHENKIKVAHVVASTKFALKCQEAGVDAVVAEGFEAGGHNGKDATGEAMLASFALGAEGVQVGTRFAITKESSANEDFKKLCTELNEGDTMLALKKLVPTRLIKNDFYRDVAAAENRGASAEELSEILGKGRAMKGIFEGDLSAGELEIGQVSCLIKDIPSAEEVIQSMINEYNEGIKHLSSI